MRPWLRRPALVLAVAAVAALPACAGEREARPQPTPLPSTAEVDYPPELARFYQQELVWAACDRFQCATLTVPVDYARPDGDTLGIAVLRRPATSESFGSLVVNPGGPGASGVDYARAGSAVASAHVLDVYDLVGFDPRGVGGSRGLACLDGKAQDAYWAADPTPDDPTEVAAKQASDAAVGQACAGSGGDLTAHVSTVEVARDLDILRAALGRGLLTYLGKSYGTAIGATYAQLFPTKVGRLVLDGAIDPSLDNTGLALGQVKGFQLALDRFIDDCVARDDCPLGQDRASATAKLQELLAGLDARPIPTGERGRPLTEGLAQIGIAYPLYLENGAGWRRLRWALEGALAGNGEQLLWLADAYTRRRQDGSYAADFAGTYNAINCLDRPGPVSRGDVEALVPQFEAASPVLGRTFAWGLLACTTWPYPTSGTAAPVVAPGALPTLVVSVTGDPATPYEWGVALADQLESGVLLTYQADGHTGYQQGNSCVDGAVDTFLLTGEPPPDGTRCT